MSIDTWESDKNFSMVTEDNPSIILLSVRIASFSSGVRALS